MTASFCVGACAGDDHANKVVEIAEVETAEVCEGPWSHDGALAADASKESRESQSLAANLRKIDKKLDRCLETIMRISTEQDLLAKSCLRNRPMLKSQGSRSFSKNKAPSFADLDAVMEAPSDTKDTKITNGVTPREDGNTECTSEHGYSERAPVRENSEWEQESSEVIQTKVSDDSSPPKKRRKSLQLQANAFVNNRRWSRSLSEEKVWAFIEDSESSNGAKWFSIVSSILIATSVVGTMVQTVNEDILPLNTLYMAVLETTFDAYLMIEFCLRLLFCPSRKSFFLDPYNIVELMAFLPLSVRIYVGFEITMDTAGWARNLLLCGVPLLRFLKLLKRFTTFRLLLGAFQEACESLPVIVYIFCNIVLAFASLLYLIEERDNIPSLPTAVYVTVITITTVGYGDITPASNTSRFVVCILSVMGGLYMAIPFGIIGQAFMRNWSDRDRILLYHKTRARMMQWGYTSRDIPVLFALFDSDSDGELTVHDFRHMMQEMRIGLTDARILQLFGIMDTDGGGSIDDQEFVRCLFPGDFHEIYGNDETANESDESDDESKSDKVSASSQQGSAI